MSTDKVAASEDPRPQHQRSESRCRSCGFDVAVDDAGAAASETVAHHLFLDCPQHSIARARMWKRISKVVRYHSQNELQGCLLFLNLHAGDNSGQEQVSIDLEVP